MPIAVNVDDTAGVTVVLATVQLAVAVDATVPAVIEYPAGAEPPCKSDPTSVQFETAAVPALVVLRLLDA